MGSPDIHIAPLSDIQKTYDELVQIFKRREQSMIYLVKVIDHQGRETWALPYKDTNNG